MSGRRRMVVLASAVASVLTAAAIAGCSSTDQRGAAIPARAQHGKQLVEGLGCAACHSTDGSAGSGPTFAGAWGRQVPLADGSTATFDAAYVTRSIRDPSAQVVKGYAATMPASPLSQSDIDDITAYLQTLGSATSSSSSG